jgi:hypothetical protein
MDFFIQIIYVSLAIAGIFVLFRQECIKDFDKIEGELGHEWFLIQSHIWANDVKNTVNDLSVFINSETDSYSAEGSDDPLTDIFSEVTKVRILTSRLNELTTAYNSYSGFNDILAEYSKSNSVFKKWIERSLAFLLIFTIWGLVGVYMSSTIVEEYWSLYLWNIFYFLLLFFIPILFKLVYTYHNVESLKGQIRNEKSKYSHILQVSK